MSVGVKSSHKNDLYKDYFKISFCIVKKYDILSKKKLYKTSYYLSKFQDTIINADRVFTNGSYNI